MAVKSMSAAEPQEESLMRALMERVKAVRAEKKEVRLKWGERGGEGGRTLERNSAGDVELHRARALTVSSPR